MRSRPIRTVSGSHLCGLPADGVLDLAQYNYPGLPVVTCRPRPNPHKGNPCNIAQDQGPLLCCLDDNSKPVCPRPTNESGTL